MLKKKLLTVALALISGAAMASPVVVSGSIYNIDGDHDGFIDDLKISRVTFNVAAGTTVFFDSRVWESTGVDLNGDGYLTGFDNFMVLMQGSTVLTAQDDSSETFGDGSVHSYDSAYSYTFATAGNYMITLGQLSYSGTDAFQGYTANRNFSDYEGGNDNFGAWQLTMTATGGTLSNVVALDDAQNAVPEPGSFVLVGMGLVGVAMSRKRKSRQA